MEKSFGIPIDEIQNYFYEQVTEHSLFGEISRQQKRDNTINRIAQLYLDLLGKEFAHAIKEPLVLRNSTNCPIFHFVFASHNETGVKIAMGFVSNYAPYELSPQIYDMPVIQKKVHLFSRRGEPAYNNK